MSQGTGATAGRLGTGHWTGSTGTHTGTGGQCTDAVKAGVGADGLACIHTGMGTWKRRLWVGERQGRGCLQNAQLDGQNG